MPNRLAHETSPYLLQHAENPVDWYPWGESALRLAREQDKPILLSIGYSACHWCHVMAHESFEDPEIAALMNDLFVNIKVDREERPDLDALYMIAVQMMTGHGGWPMTVFLTPDGRPFYGGTYFPPSDRGAMAGFPRVLRGVAEVYRDRRADIDASADNITAHLAQHFSAAPGGSRLDERLLEEAARSLAGQYDRLNGGFGGAPKFPSPMALELLLRLHTRFGSARALEMVEQTLDKMARGGIYDQVGGGFHRYAVDAIWLVPHFEKMLYDNAQLAHIYTLAWQATGEQLYQHIATETLEYVLREMTSPEGGFYSSQDADTEGHEGKFFIWTPDELEAVLGPDDGARVARYLNVTRRGNFEGSNVLSIPDPHDPLEWRAEPLATLRQRLYAARATRTWPGRDEKVLTSWNGLMLRAFATAAWVFDEPRYRAAARRNAQFVLAELTLPGNRLQRTWKDGVAKLDGYLEDYACFIDGLLSLYAATFEPQWLAAARSLAQTMVAEFYDSNTGAFYDTGRSHEALVVRPRDSYDSATPSGTSVACDVLLRLGYLTGDDAYARVAREVLTSLGAHAAANAHGYARLLCALDLAVGPVAEVALVGAPAAEDMARLLTALRERYLPRVLVAAGAPDDVAALEAAPLLAGRPQREGRATAYVCRNFACQLPVTDAASMMEQVQAVSLGG
ncbi:MAG: thioredoxin domain-containing protein [Chloroflexi bacterium]|nr:MAG: thioredoxin domain-containing protein [Chloroflexota bacterium]